MISHDEILWSRLVYLLCCCLEYIYFTSVVMHCNHWCCWQCERGSGSTKQRREKRNSKQCGCRNAASERQTTRKCDELGPKPKRAIPATRRPSRLQCDTSMWSYGSSAYVLFAGPRGAISHTQPLSYGNTIHLPFPPSQHDLIHFVTTETSLTTPGVAGTTSVTCSPAQKLRYAEKSS